MDPAFVANVVGVHGDAGRQWLPDIPRLLGELEASWGLQISAPYELSYNYVAPATSRSGTRCVVKLTVPGSEALTREAVALASYAGNGAVRLLARDDRRGALLLERAEPGLQLAEWGPDRDSEATSILCSVMQDLWRAPAPDRGLPNLVDYGHAFADYDGRYAGSGPLPQVLVDRARNLLDQLAGTAARTVLLHGDLHHHNVLQAGGDSWLAIDPHGVIGDPGFDIGPMLYNPLTRDVEELRRLLPARLDQLSGLTGLPDDRVRAWGFVMSVLSEVWTSEDRDGIDGRPLAVAEAILHRG